MCTHRMNEEPDGLVCDRVTSHDEESQGGHTYTSSTGSHVRGAHGEEQVHG